MRPASAAKPVLQKHAGLALRVGNVNGNFSWYQRTETGPAEFRLVWQDLTPLSLKGIQGARAGIQVPLVLYHQDCH